MAEEKMELYWSRFQNNYDNNQEYVVGMDLLDIVKDKIMKLPDLGELLELGCGTGYFTETIAQKANHVFATDLSNELLKMADRRLNKFDNITIQKENCLNTSFTSNNINSVFMANLIHVIENPLEVLRESHRILKDNGLLIITSFTNYGMKPLEIIKLGLRFVKVWGKPPQYTHRFTPESLAFLMESAGFSIQEAINMGDKTKALYLIGRKNSA